MHLISSFDGVLDFVDYMFCLGFPLALPVFYLVAVLDESFGIMFFNCCFDYVCPLAFTVGFNCFQVRWKIMGG